MTTYRHSPIRTSTGVLIGGAYVPPPAPMSADAETVQSLLLKEEADRKADRVVVRTCLLALVSLIVILALS